MLCFIQNINSQRDFRKGFVITNKKDTLKGFIDYREGSKKFSFCDFKQTENSAIITYLPYQIKGYGIFNNSYFESKEISTVNNSIEKVFIEILVRGKATLYKLREAFFIGKYDTIFKKLYNRQKVVTVDRKKYKRNTNRYIGILKYLLSDCSKLKGKISKILLSEKSLTKLIENYNACSNEPSMSFKEKKRWFKMHFGLFLGVNTSSMSIKPDLPTGLSNFSGNFSNENSIMPGFFMNLSSPRLNERISFYTEVAFLNTTYQAFDVFNYGANTERNDISISLKQIKIPIGFRYTFPVKMITPYFTVGISNTITDVSNTSWVIEREKYNIVETSDGIPFELNSTRFGYWLGFGVKRSLVDKLNGFIEVKYEYSSGTTYVSGLPTTYNIPNIQFLIGLSF